MRYKACTSCDIEFLRSKVAGKGPNDLKLMQQRKDSEMFQLSPPGMLRQAK
jgi:hypothetical protein